MPLDEEKIEHHLSEIDFKLSRLNTDMLIHLRPPSAWTIAKGVVLGLFIWCVITTIFWTVFWTLFSASVLAFIKALLQG